MQIKVLYAVSMRVLKQKYLKARMDTAWRALKIAALFRMRFQGNKARAEHRHIYRRL
jgi:hypothetical protein